MDYLKELLPLRQKMELTQAAMASFIGVSQQVYSLAESGKTKRIDPKIIDFVTRNIVDNNKNEDVGNTKTDNDITNTLYALAEGNRLLAESNKKLSEANLQLTKLAAKGTGDELLDIPVKMIPRFVSLMKLIAKAGSEGWKTTEEALIEINNSFYAELGIKKQEGR